MTALSATVTAPAGCNWIAVSGVPWIGVSSGQSGSGNGTVQLVAAQNTGIQRSGVVSIAGVQFTVTQSNACNFSLSSTTESFTSAGGPGSFSAFTSMGCTLPTAVSSVSWIHITSGAGVSPFTFTVDASTLGFARSGTITLGSQVFTVIEAAVPTMVQVTFNANISGVTLTTIGVGCSPGAYTLPITLSWASGAACIVNMPAPNGYAFALWMDGPTASSRTITAGASAATYSGVFSGCTYSVTAPGKIVNAAGGSLSITISTQTGCSWTPVSSTAWASVQGGGAGAGSGTATLTLIANPGLPRKTTVSVAGSSVTVHQAGIAYPIVFRPSNGTWYVSRTATSGSPSIQQWGYPNDVPVPGDYDGDGKPDYAVWRPSTGTWWVMPSASRGALIIQQWGYAGDVPVPGDYDGDGKTDFAIWRPSTGTWWVMPSSAPGTLIVQQWGYAGDIPVPGDYDGDGKTDFAIWRPSTGTWWVMPSSAPGTVTIQQWGYPGDIPVPGDYDGDGKTDFAIWRPSTGTWWVMQSAYLGQPLVQQWGYSGDAPVPADYDGDGKTDFAIWRPSTGTWWAIPSASPAAFLIQQWGLPGDIPAVTPLPN
ncbi:MAG: FG-GAP-like repeat-containing protein [Bryobacteraceae bacterium]